MSSCAVRTVKIGAAVGTTGVTSGIGVHGRNGMEIAVARLNAAGGIKGRPVELLVENDRDDPDGAVAADGLLLDQGAVAVVGHMSSAAASKAVEYMSRRKAVLISPTASSPDYSGKDDYFFRTIGISDIQGQNIAAEALRRGFKRASAIYEVQNASYTESVLRGFKAAFQAGGGTVTTEFPVRSSADFDYRELVARIVEDGPDLLLCATSSFDLASIRQALFLSGVEIPTFASMWARTPDLMVFGGRTVEGVVLVGGTDPLNPDPAIAEFRREYLLRYGEEPVFAALYAYEAVMVLAQALERARRWDGPGIKESLLAHSPYLGIQGEIRFDAYGDADRPYLLYEVRGGEFRPLR